MDDGRRVAVFEAHGSVVVVDDACTHNGASLANWGEIREDAIECTWHACRFELCTGKVMGGPCETPLKVYQVAVNGDGVFLIVDGA